MTAPTGGAFDPPASDPAPGRVDAADEELDFSEGDDDYHEDVGDPNLINHLDDMYEAASNVAPEGTGGADDADAAPTAARNAVRRIHEPPAEDMRPGRVGHGGGGAEARDGGGKKRKHTGGYDRKRKSSLKRNDAALSESHARIWRWAIIITLSIGIIIGFKNMIFPPSSLSLGDVRQEIYQTTGTTKFPLDRGAAVATGFVEAYIPISDNPAASSMLENYYAGERFKTTDAPTSSEMGPSASSGISQVIQAGPFVYKQKAVSDNTANYVIGSLVYRRMDGKPVTTPDGKSPDYRWLYLNVGIYWDEKTDRLAIDPNSPTVTEPPDMAPSTSLPPAQLPGDGNLDQDATKEAGDAVRNFMKSWSAGDRSSLKTLTAPDATPSALSGLDGRLAIDTSSMKLSVYGHPPTDGMYRALVDMKWSDVVSRTDGQDNAVQYNSKYILKLEKTPEGKYLVQDINPYYYVPGR